MAYRQFHSFRKIVLHPLKFKLFQLSSLPSSFFAGLKVRSFDEYSCSVSVRYKWFNKNPFHSLYFAILGMAAEMSTGTLCMAYLYKRKPGASMLVTRIEGEYYKKAVGTISFTCRMGKEIEELIESCYSTLQPGSIRCETTGRNETGEEVARFWITWSFKVRKEKLA
jgi:hypothetical protein